MLSGRCHNSVTGVCIGFGPRVSLEATDGWRPSESICLRQVWDFLQTSKGDCDGKPAGGAHALRLAAADAGSWTPGRPLGPFASWRSLRVRRAHPDGRAAQPLPDRLGVELQEPAAELGREHIAGWGAVWSRRDRFRGHPRSDARRPGRSGHPAPEHLLLPRERAGRPAAPPRRFPRAQRQAAADHHRPRFRTPWRASPPLGFPRSSRRAPASRRPPRPRPATTPHFPAGPCAPGRRSTGPPGCRTRSASTRGPPPPRPRRCVTDCTPDRPRSRPAASNSRSRVGFAWSIRQG